MARKKPSYANAAIVPPTPIRRRGKGAEAKMDPGTASWCHELIRTYDNEFQNWEKRAREIVKRYRDERDETQQNARRFNILWSNVEVLKPTLYARQPSAEVVRRFKDSDPIARIGSELAERAADYEIEQTELHDRMKQVVVDRLLGGRGQLWVSYAGNKETGEDKLQVDYVDWEEFGHTPVPTWAEVKQVWRWKYFDRDAYKARFGDKFIDKVEFSARRDKSDNTEREPEARVAELWDKVSGKVYWVSNAVSDYLDEYDAPLELEGFFPCPRPLYSTLTNETLVPVPDFYLYQDQANEVDKLTGRIVNLTNALKVVGVYDQDQKSLADLLDPRGVGDNTLVPVNMADLTGKGGLNAGVQLVDITTVVNALAACYDSRARAIQAIYEITGISDVLRGSSDPNETARAQDIKAQFGGTRIREKQQDVAQFARDVIRIMTEIVVEMYDPETLWNMTSAVSYVGTMPAPQLPAVPGQPPVPAPPPQPNVQAFADALKFLRNDRLRSYRVDIETDSTIALDEADAKRDATEFITAIGAFLGQAQQVMQVQPKLAPMLGEFLMFIVRRYKAGRTLEGSIENAVAMVANSPPAMTPEQVAEAQKQIEAGKKELATMGQKAKDAQTKADLDAIQNRFDEQLLKFQQQYGQKMLAVETKDAQLSIKGEVQKAASVMQKAVGDLDASTASALAAQKPDRERDAKKAAQRGEDQAWQKALLQNQAQMAEAMMQGFSMMAQAIAAPKSLTVERKNGQVVGATAATRMN